MLILLVFPTLRGRSYVQVLEGKTTHASSALSVLLLGTLGVGHDCYVGAMVELERHQEIGKLKIADSRDDPMHDIIVILAYL